MPITGSLVTQAILTASPTLRGPVWTQLAGAVGTSVVTWTSSSLNVLLLGSVNGTIGGGVVLGKFFMVPAPLPVNAAVSASGLVGPLSVPMAAAIGIGVGSAYNVSAGYRGTATGAIGADLSKVTFANPATLIALLMANLTARGIIGMVSAELAIGVGNGIATMFLTGTGTGVATGAPGPSPGTGISRSGIF